MITLYKDRELTGTPGEFINDLKFQEMYIDTDVFYKLFFLLHQFGIEDYFTFEIEQNGRGVYVRIIKREGNINEIC